MHNDHFDQILTEIASGAPRRTVLGGLAGLLAAGLGAGAEARRKKKKKKCKGGTTKCGKQCFNLQSDNLNCGACGNACSGGQSCSGGACTCPASQTFLAGACIPRFGCTLDLDTCTFGKKACPEFTNESDARCYVSSDGEPFCGTNFTCDAVAPGGTCPTVGSEARTFIPCSLCVGTGETGACVRPISRVRA
ncbi:MAG: hypothetical protein U0075_16110 [Thermomicrobiales bacterium]